MPVANRVDRELSEAARTKLQRIFGRSSFGHSYKVTTLLTLSVSIGSLFFSSCIYTFLRAHAPLIEQREKSATMASNDPPRFDDSEDEEDFNPAPADMSDEEHGDDNDADEDARDEKRGAKRARSPDDEDGDDDDEGARSKSRGGDDEGSGDEEEEAGDDDEDDEEDEDDEDEDVQQVRFREIYSHGCYCLA